MDGPRTTTFGSNAIISTFDALGDPGVDFGLDEGDLLPADAARLREGLVIDKAVDCRLGQTNAVHHDDHGQKTFLHGIIPISLFKLIESCRFLKALRSRYLARNAVQLLSLRIGFGLAFGFDRAHGGFAIDA